MPEKKKPKSLKELAEEARRNFEKEMKKLGKGYPCRDRGR